MPFNVDEVTFDELEDQDDSPKDLENNDDLEDEDLEQDQPESKEEAGEVEEPDSFDNLDEDIDDDLDSDEDEEPTDEDENTDVDQDEEMEEEEARFVDDLASQFGLDPDEDLDGEVEDTWDDALKVARKGAETMATQEINGFFEKYPDIAEYAQFRVNGGDPDTFREEVLNAPSYDDLELEGNEQTQERVVREKLQEVDGFSDEKVDQKIENYKSGGILKSEAEDARDIMSNKQEQKREQLIEEQEKKAEQRRQEQLEEQKRYKETIRESNSLGDLQLPENKKDDFEEYLFEPVDEDGLTQAERDYQNMSRDEALALYYVMFEGGPDNLGSLVDNKASTKKAEQISNKLSKSSSRSVKDRSEKSGRSGRDESPNLEGFNLDQQIG